MGSISARERRLIALLILTALGALIWMLIVAPLMNGFTTRQERREQLALQYQHNLRTIGGIPRLRRQAEREAKAIVDFQISSANLEGGREWLKARVQRAIEKSGGEFRDAGDAEGRPGWAKVRATARLTLPQLAAALEQIQNAPPWLIVETVTITANDALVTGQSSSMDVQLEASVPLRAAAAR
ncbi:MAG: hypothetical protein J7498_01930 [Sphingobium sp.]|nr:hypothetical protein [Sphingobium sp.]